MFLIRTSQITKNMALLVDVEGADEAAKQTEPYWKLYSGGDR